jgi:hypothetical protein
LPSCDNLILLAVGVIVFDLSAPVADISTLLYTAVPAIRTRLNAVYQIAMFAGGSLMSILVGFC